MLGLPHDVAGAALLAHLLAGELGLEPGVLSYRIAHAHIYGAHEDAARELLRRTGHTHPEVRLSVATDALGRAMSADAESMDTVVSEVLESLAAQYEPGAGVGRLRIFV
jgi:thymidylate synthase